MNDFRFADPQWVHLLWGVGIAVALLFWLDRRGGRALSSFVSRALQDRLVRQPTALRRGLRIGLLGLSAVFLVLALMRPQWGLEFVRTPRVGAEIMIALDVSRSMLAEDVAPNRLERAKAEIRDLLGYLDGDQVGLIAFAGRASVVSPLTPDFSFLRLVLDGLEVGSVRPGGTRLEEPIRKAVAGFGEVGEAARVLLLITDGEDHDSFPLDAAKEAAERGVVILAVGFGDEAGSEIRVTDPLTGARTVVRDAAGNVVRSRLDGDLLRELALATEGAYIPAGTGVLDLESIFEAHIAPLMRGEVDARGRTVQQEGYQWAVLLALLALFGSVSTQARTATLGVLAIATFGTALVAAPNAALAQVGAVPDATLADEPADAESAELERLEIPEDPRSAYNAGVERLTGGQLDDAERLFESARAAAGRDGETRYRATYNLGWTAVRRADEQASSDPAAALASLERSADWFREAVAMRPDSEDARRNLEIVLQRALILRDQLNQQDERDLATRLDELIEAQRAAIATIRPIVEQVAGSDDPNALSGMREAFRGAAVVEREVLSDAAGFADVAGAELATLEAIAEEERSAEDAMRISQIQALLHYVHRARERIGQARSQLRRRQAEPAFRRSAAGLTSLKRARDQLRDPARVLDSILTDAARQSLETRALLAAETGLALKGPEEDELVAPEWLTSNYLSESQEDLAGRAGELQARLHAGVAALADAPPDDPAARLLAEVVAGAEPLVRTAHDQMLVAHRELSDGHVEPAIAPQADATLRLAQARELFLDLKGLIEVAYTDQRRIEEFVSPGEDAADTPLGEYAPALKRLQEENLARTKRLVPLLDLEEATRASQASQAEADAEKLAAQAEDRARLFESARALVGFARGGMQEVDAGLAAVQGGEAPGDALRENAADATRALAQLRRLFFSIVEHLRETAERQQSLGDETEPALALFEAEPEDSAQQLGRLAARQTELAEVAEQIAFGLHEQALAGPPAASDDAAGDARAAEVTQRMTQAAELVLAGQEAMVAASEGMQAEAIDGEAVRGEQGTAFEKLAEALALLVPPQQQQPPQQEQQAGDEQQEQQQAGGSQAEDGAEEQGDPAQILQAVRDREAQRHRERAEREMQGYEPVEKDW